MTASVVQFVTAADQVLETEERLGDLVEHLREIGERLDTLEAMPVEAAGADPLTEILARIEAVETRLTRLEKRQRRPPPFPITVIESHLDPEQERRYAGLSQDVYNERFERQKADSDLHHVQQGFNGSMASFNRRLDRCADQFCRMRERLTAIEARVAGDDKGAAT
jgi:primosomal protein N''